MNYEKSMYDQPVLSEGTKVVVKNLGDDKVYHGEISGVSFASPTKVMFYVVALAAEMIDYNYSNMIITPACVFLDKE